MGLVEMPSNFSWVVDGLLAACAYPREESHFRYLRQHGVARLISLTERPAPAHKAGVELEVIHIGMPDFTPPSIAQVEDFIGHLVKAKTEGKAVAVHCQLGRGRTGTMCACYFVYSQGMTSHDAIVAIRRLRPGSIETIEQEQLVKQYANHLKETAPSANQ